MQRHIGGGDVGLVEQVQRSPQGERSIRCGEHDPVAIGGELRGQRFEDRQCRFSLRSRDFQFDDGAAGAVLPVARHPDKVGNCRFSGGLVLAGGRVCLVLLRAPDRCQGSTSGWLGPGSALGPIAKRRVAPWRRPPGSGDSCGRGKERRLCFRVFTVGFGCWVLGGWVSCLPGVLCVTRGKLRKGCGAWRPALPWCSTTRTASEAPSTPFGPSRVRRRRIEERCWVPKLRHDLVADIVSLREERSQSIPTPQQLEQLLRVHQIEANEAPEVHHVFERGAHERDGEVSEVLPAKQGCRANALQLSAERRVDREQPVVGIDVSPHEFADSQQAVGGDAGEALDCLDALKQRCRAVDELVVVDSRHESMYSSPLCSRAGRSAPVRAMLPARVRGAARRWRRR